MRANPSGRPLLWSRAKNQLVFPLAHSSACSPAGSSIGARPLSRWASVPPATARPLARSSRGGLSARVSQALKRPCLSPPWSLSPRASASARRVGSALPLGSNHRRGSLRLCTASPRPSRFPPALALFPLSLQGRGALVVAPAGSPPRWVAFRAPLPKRVKIYATAYICKNF